MKRRLKLLIEMAQLLMYIRAETTDAEYYFKLLM
jgi:hypothetical protein